MLEFTNWVKLYENEQFFQGNMDKALDICKEKYKTELMQLLQTLADKDDEIKDALENSSEEDEETTDQEERVLQNPNDVESDPSMQ